MPIYNKPNISSQFISLGDFAFSPHIVGFCYLFDLLRWFNDSRRSFSYMSGEFLHDDTKEIYYQANPIIIFRRDKINIKKLERIFVEFQEKRDHNNEKNQNMTDDPLSKIPDFENPLAYLNDYMEKYKTERFLHVNPYLKYFAICNMTKVEVKKDESETIKNEPNEPDDIINSADDITATGSKWQKKYSENIDINGINDKCTENYLCNDIDSRWERLEDNSFYNRDIDMDQQSPEFWDNL